MKLAVLSDIHLGVEPRIDEFGHTRRGFERFLDRLEAAHDRIVLNGDIVEGLRGRRLGARTRRQQTYLARHRHQELLSRLVSPTYLWATGNHDPDLSEMGLPSYRRLEVDGSVLLFVHGHDHDRLARILPGASPVVNWLNAWTNRWTGRDADHGLFRLEAWLLGLRDTPEDDVFQRAHVGAAARDGADIVIVGHTHVGGVWPHPEAIYANSGTCSLGQFEWLSIDTAQHRIAFHRDHVDAPPIAQVHWTPGR